MPGAAFPPFEIHRASYREPLGAGGTHIDIGRFAFLAADRPPDRWSKWSEDGQQHDFRGDPPQSLRRAAAWESELVRPPGRVSLISRQFGRGGGSRWPYPSARKCPRMDARDTDPPAC